LPGIQEITENTVIKREKEGKTVLKGGVRLRLETTAGRVCRDDSFPILNAFHPSAGKAIKNENQFFNLCMLDGFDLVFDASVEI